MMDEPAPPPIIDEDGADLTAWLRLDRPTVELSSFAGQAQRHFQEADISVTALSWHPDRPDAAIAQLLRAYRQQLLRGRTQLAKARLLRQPVGPAVDLLERMLAEHEQLLQALLPRLSAEARAHVRHTLYLVGQLHRSAQASRRQRSIPPVAGGSAARRVVNPGETLQWAVGAAVLPSGPLRQQGAVSMGSAARLRATAGAPP